MAKMRWRLIVGAVSLGAAVILTLPAVGAARPISRPAPVIWPGGVAAIGDIIWPNGPATDTIWPNPIVVDGPSGGTSSP
jgi:hypothetical protein